MTVSEIEQARKSGDLTKAMALVKDHAMAHGGNLTEAAGHQYAMILMQSKLWDSALAVLSLLAKQLPENAQVRYQIGTCLEALHQYVDAKDAFKHATMLHAKHDQPDAGRAWFGLGSCLYRLGKDREAKAAWETGLQWSVSSADGRFQRSLVLLALGDYERGWKAYESRKELHGYQQSLKPRGVPDELPPEWDGQSKGRVMVYGTQGNGDTIQFTRYLPFVAERSGCEPRLIAGDELAPWLGHDWRVPCQWSVAIDSLPLVLGMYEPIPPMLISGEQARGVMAGLMKHIPPTIGVCWKGNPNHSNDRDRSSPISFLEAFVDSRWSVVSLQQGEGVHFANYAQTAQLIATLDAVVTVDTSIAHVAGTIGCPTIVIPQCSRDYRWGLSGDRTPWYPSVRIVRRHRWDDWAGAIERAKLKLRGML